jgi:hypothetical protein
MAMLAAHGVILVLTVTVAIAMLWRFRSGPSFLVAAGAAGQVVGVLIQLAARPVELPQGDAVIDLGSDWRLGTILVSVSSIAFLAGLLSHFLGSQRGGRRAPMSSTRPQGRE